MEQKLLILALGTTGGEVGLAFKQQVAQRTPRDFYYKILCLDTSDQLRKSGRVAPNEFVHIVTEEHYIRNIIANSEIAAPKLHQMLYPNFPPPPSTANGAGNIRYSAAALLALSALQNNIRSSLNMLIGQLADMGETKSRDISFVIVISAVGATGSGAMSLLLPLILETAHNAGIAEPKIDVIILHPVLNVSDISDKQLLANAEALYIELAAMQNDPIHNSYTGRKIILGSGGQSHTITKLEELERTAATLLRLITDARYGITQPYWGSLPNRGVLRGLEIQTLLPTHLSSATPVTIGLANLGKQVIDVDTAKFISRFIYGAQHQKQDAPQSEVNKLLSHLASLQGSDTESSYRLLLDELTATLRNGLGSNGLSIATLTRLNNRQKADQIRAQYQSDLDFIEKEKAKILPQAQQKFKDLQKALSDERENYILKDCPLVQLLNDYREMLDRIKKIQAAASKVKVSPPVSDEQLTQMRDSVAAHGRPQAINNYIDAVQQNLISRCEAVAVQTAVRFLTGLENECQDAIRRIQAFIQEATERFRNKPGWNSNPSALQVQNDHSLYISALSNKQDIEQYYNHVSIFSQSDVQQGLFNEGDGIQPDPLAPFREELEQRDLVKHFFDGNYNKIFTAIEQYVERRIKDQLDNYPLMNVFESMRPAVLHDCLTQALGRAQSLMPFARGYAASSVEECYVTASWSNERQHSMLEEALSQISQKATLIQSDDPTEIVILYLVDGLAITALNDLTSRCLGAFLEQRSLWTLYNSNRALRGSMRGNPVYSGYNFELQVKQQGIVHRLYKAKQLSVAEYNKDQVPELADPAAPDAPDPFLNGNGGANGLPAKPIGDIMNTQRRSQSGDEHVQQQNPPVAD
jgi:hypothetical protein